MDTRFLLPQAVAAAIPTIRIIRRPATASIVVVALGAAGCAAGTSESAGTSTTSGSGGDRNTPNSTDTGDTPMPDGPADDFDWDTILAAFVPEVAPGWSEPVFLDTSREGWFESQHISPDGQTLYFTSNRGRPGEGPWIHASERLDAEGQEWSEPEVVVKSRLAAGEPTMPADESRLFFVQFVMNDNINSETGLGEFRTAMYYIEPE